VVALGAAAVTAVLGLAACGPLGGSDAKGGGKAPATGVPAAAGGTSGVVRAVQALDLVKKRTSGVHSARIEGRMRMGTTMDLSTNGVMDWSHGMQGTATITYNGGALAGMMSRSGFGTTLQARYLYDAYYARVNAKAAPELGGKHWLRYGWAELAKLSGGNTASLQDQLQNNNPERSLQYILASGDVHKVGTDTVRGVVATHYAGTLDTAKLARQTSRNLSAAELAQAQRLLKKSGITTEHIDLWVSADNLPVESATSALSRTGTVSTTAYYSDFGVPVHVEAPPASDCLDIGTLIGNTGKNARKNAGGTA
jgi:hypothetical protein